LASRLLGVKARDCVFDKVIVTKCIHRNACDKDTKSRQKDGFRSGAEFHCVCPLKNLRIITATITPEITLVKIACELIAFVMG
tara:strand:+ start:17988 stop:18236 length:249 start_codon:yes stop_codon:yes gene_type:complete